MPRYPAGRGLCSNASASHSQQPTPNAAKNAEGPGPGARGSGGLGRCCCPVLVIVTFVGAIWFGQDCPCGGVWLTGDCPGPPSSTQRRKENDGTTTVMYDRSGCAKKTPRIHVWLRRAQRLQDDAGVHNPHLGSSRPRAVTVQAFLFMDESRMIMTPARPSWPEPRQG